MTVRSPESDPGAPEPQGGGGPAPGDVGNGGNGESSGNGGDAGNGGTGRGRRRAKKKTSFWKELPVLIVLALGLALVIKTFLVQAFYIPSESMENTLLPGDRVLVNKLSYSFGEIQRGDVIVFNGANSWEPEIVYDEPSNVVEQALRGMGELFGFSPIGEKDFIKRVIGLPGDEVACCDDDGRLTVNGQPVEESEYLYPGDSPSVTGFDIEVPAERLWVMGDHRSASADSRAHIGDPGGGTIPVDQVIGRAFVTVWPLDRAGLLSRGSGFADAGLASEDAGLASEDAGLASEPERGDVAPGPDDAAASSGVALLPAAVFAGAVGRSDRGARRRGRA